MIGRTISHYRITGNLGAGGMGVVYRAEDTNLNRQVAIKVLPDIFGGDHERLARFEREAKLLASLNHPNIASIYGLEQADGKRFLVLELVEGETLAQRIAKGPLPVDDALEVCRQISEGLEAAHEKGIIHRDLKPANVKITPEGKVKVLDFGLAKALSEEPTTADLSHSPTLTDPMTCPGVILGTAAYMSPEQAKGKAVDKRADIWAFGCVLYECLTGHRTFQGDTITEIVASILKSEPNWLDLPAETPTIVRSLLRRCLQKDPHLRLRDIGDVRIEIGESATKDAVPTEAVPAPRRFSLLWLAACAVVIAIASLLTGLTLRGYLQPAPSATVVTSTIKVEPGHWLDGMRNADFSLQRPSRTAMAISSDGVFIVYSAIEENPGPQAKPQLYMRRMGQSKANPIPGTDGGINPFLSPDNRWVGFWADNKLSKVPIEGGGPIALCDNLQWLYGASWSRDNSIVFSDGWETGLSIVSADGGNHEPLTDLDPQRDELSHRLPFWLPDGKAVLFTVMKHYFDRLPRVALLRMDTRKWDVLLENAADARYIPTGHLVFLRQGKLMAVRFDLAAHKAIGEPSLIEENVMQAFSDDAGIHSGAGQFAVSDTGVLIYAAGGIIPDENRSLVWVDQGGVEQPVTDLRAPFVGPRLSPDGKRIAYITEGRIYRVWTYDLDRGVPSEVSPEGIPTPPIWTFDGKQLLFGWFESAALNLFRQPYDGSSRMVRYATSKNIQCPGSWSGDGRTLAFVEIHQDANHDILLFDTQTRQVTKFLAEPLVDEKYPEFSPDGRWIAYTSNKLGHSEVYLQPFPSLSTLIKVSREGGIEPAWARNSRQLFYRWPEKRPNQMWVVDVPADGNQPSKPRMLPDISGYYSGDPFRCYDLSLDSKRFLMVKLEQRKPTPVTEMTLVQNWFEELKRLVPTGK